LANFDARTPRIRAVSCGLGDAKVSRAFQEDHTVRE